MIQNKILSFVLIVVSYQLCCKGSIIISFYKMFTQESGSGRTVFLQTPNLQLFSSETPMYRAFAGSWRLL